MKKNQAIERVKNWIRLQEILQVITQQYENSTNLVNSRMWVVEELSPEELAKQMDKISRRMDSIQLEVENTGLDFHELVREVHQAKVRLLTFETEEEIMDEVERLAKENVKCIIDSNAHFLFGESRYTAFISRQVDLISKEAKDLISREARESVSSYDFMEHLIPAFNLLYLLGNRKYCRKYTQLELLDETPFSIDSLGDWDNVLTKGAETILAYLVYWKTEEKLKEIIIRTINMIVRVVEDYEEIGIPQEVAESINTDGIKFFPRNTPLFKERETAIILNEELAISIFLDSQIKNNQCAIICDVEEYTIAFLWEQD